MVIVIALTSYDGLPYSRAGHGRQSGQLAPLLQIGPDKPHRHDLAIVCVSDGQPGPALASRLQGKPLVL
jgi:hypothetical protein